MDRAPKASPFFLSKSAAHYSIFLFPAIIGPLLLLFELPFQVTQSGFSQPIKAKSCKELQFQGEKIAAGESLHSRLSVPTADRLVSGDPL